MSKQPINTPEGRKQADDELALIKQVIKDHRDAGGRDWVDAYIDVTIPGHHWCVKIQAARSDDRDRPVGR